MKTLFSYFPILMSLIVCLASCDSDDDKLTAEEIAYIERNEAYIEEKTLEKDEAGDLLYQRIEYGGYTVLYRILEKEGEDMTPITVEDRVYLQLKGEHINGQTFQPDAEMDFYPSQVVSGLALVLLEAHKGEKVEAIIPAALGYGLNDKNGIPKGSTLIFTFTILDVK